MKVLNKVIGDNITLHDWANWGFTTKSGKSGMCPKQNGISKISLEPVIYIYILVSPHYECN